MENLYDKILSMKKYKLAHQQVLIESSISLEGNDDVEKVLAIDSNVDIDPQIEAMDNECLINGKIVTNLVYSTVDGELNNQVSITPFNYKLSDERVAVGSKINVHADVVGTNLEKTVNGVMKVVSTIDIEAAIVKNDEVKYLKDNIEDSFIKQKEMEVISFVGGYCEKFEEKLETSVKTGVKKILATNASCLLKEWQTGPNFISLECELYVKLLYADNQDPSELQTITISKNIKQEIEADGINKDCDLDVFATIINENVFVEISEGEDGCVISVLVPIVACYNKYEKNKSLMVADIYSCKNILSIQNHDVSNCKALKPEYIEGKIEGNVVLGENEYRIDKYLATTNVKVITSDSYIKDKTMFLEGIITANVIYLNDEVGTVQSVEIEIPFVLDKRVDVTEDVILEPAIGLFDIDVMIKRGREIYFDAKVKAFINLTCENNFSIISQIESIGELQERSGAIEIYFGKEGESIWDIAKSLKISGEIIRNQNPEICDPLDKDQNIAIYFQKQK